MVWPMVELEADDTLASAAAVAADDNGVEQVLVCTPDKDLAQCVQGTRVVQLDRRKDVITDEEAVRARYGIGPLSIPDWLALVGRQRGRVPRPPGLGQAVGVDGARALRAPRGDPGRRRGLGSRPAELRAQRRQTRRTPGVGHGRRPVVPRPGDVARGPLAAASVDDLEWKGPGDDFEDIARFLRDPALADRATASAPSGRPRRSPASGTTVRP